MSSLQFKLNQ